MAAAAPFYGLHLVGSRAVLEEIRHHARGVASAAALGWDGALLDQLEAEHDPAGAAYRHAQSQLERIRAANPSVRYIYLMRRPRLPLAPATAFEYVVDAPALDYNGNGRIDRDEESEPPGTAYDASGLPEMVRGWTEPSADCGLTPDLPYPDVLSGYAPIRDARGWTRALVGVDITARTVADRLRMLHTVALAGWVLTSLLLTLVAHFYLRQRFALARLEALNRELAERNELLHASSQLMAHEADQMARERRLAQAFQSGLVRGPPRPVIRRVFDKPYLVALAHGAAMVEVFDLDADHVGFCHAQAVGADRRSNLAAHLLRTAIFAWRDHGAAPTTRARVPMTEPDRVLAWLNALLLRELPPGELAGLLYGVVNISSGALRVACAAHPLPLLFSSADGSLAGLVGLPGLALGLDRQAEFPAVCRTLHQGDRLLVVGQEVLDAPGPNGSAWGEERLRDALVPHAGEPPDLLAEAVADAVAARGGPAAPPDDRSFLLLHLR